MRVLYLTMNPNMVSTTVSMGGWFRCLRERGLAPVLASNEIGAFHAWAQGEGIPSYHIPLPFPSKARPWLFFRSLWRLRGVVRRHRVQLVHCNEQDIYPIGSALGRICGLPVVVNIRCRMEAGFSRWAFRGKRQPDRIFFVSRGNREICRSGVRDVVPEEKWRLLYNGIDIERFQPDQAQRERERRRWASDGEYLIGVACALRPGKQLEHLFEVATKINEPKTRVLLAGGPVSGFEEYARNVIDLGRERLGDRFIHVGHLGDLAGFYNGLDVMINTSEGEACSNSVIESLACGCPVLGYPSISVHEQVLPDGGEIVEQDDVQQLTETVRAWLEDPGRLRQARSAARKQAENFDIRHIADQLWDEYRTLVD